jgi:hypothetical protein
MATSHDGKRAFVSRIDSDRGAVRDLERLEGAGVIAAGPTPKGLALAGAPPQ